MLVKNVAPPSSATSNVNSTSAPTEAMFKYAYRDTKPKKPLQESRHLRGRDMTGKLGRQLLDVTDQRRREVLGRLTKLWQTKPGSQQGALSRRVMDEFLRMARTIHFCLTPLLFLPKWRYQAQATRQRGADGEGADPASSCLDEMATRKIRRHAQDEKDHELLIVDFMQDYIDYLQTGTVQLSHRKCLGGMG